MKKKKEIRKYRYPFSKEQFFENCKRYCSEHREEYLFKRLDDNNFQLGVERGGHSGGYWYVASVKGENRKR